VDNITIDRLEKSVGKILDELKVLRKENHRLVEERSRLAGELSRLREEATAQRGVQDYLLKLKKENDTHKRNARIARDQVERMLSRFQLLEE